MGDAGEAEDAAQSGFVKAYVALGRFREGAPFRPRLLQIVANEVRNRRAAASRHPAVSLDFAAETVVDRNPSRKVNAVAGGERRR